MVPQCSRHAYHNPQRIGAMPENQTSPISESGRIDEMECRRVICLKIPHSRRDLAMLALASIVAKKQRSMHIFLL